MFFYQHFLNAIRTRKAKFGQFQMDGLGETKQDSLIKLRVHEGIKEPSIWFDIATEEKISGFATCLALVIMNFSGI